MKRLGFFSLALAGVLVIGCSNERINDNTTATNGSVGTAGDADRNELKGDDRDFTRDLAIAGMAEVELGKLATERAARADVKKFAQMMIDDHTKAGDKLKAIATEKNIPFPATLDDKHVELRDKLAKLSGAEFDREYMNAMVEGHEEVAGKLESRIDTAKLAEFKTQMADQANKKVEQRATVSTVDPERSDNMVTMSLNQWSAESYPVVQMHLQSAKELNMATARK